MGAKYYKTDKWEAIDIIESVVSRETIPPRAKFCVGNAIKYLLRCGEKDPKAWALDIAKAENYLHRALTGMWIKERTK